MVHRYSVLVHQVATSLCMVDESLCFCFIVYSVCHHTCHITESLSLVHTKESLWSMITKMVEGHFCYKLSWYVHPLPHLIVTLFTAYPPFPPPHCVLHIHTTPPSLLHCSSPLTVTYTTTTLYWHTCVSHPSTLIITLCTTYPHPSPLIVTLCITLL